MPPSRTLQFWFDRRFLTPERFVFYTQSFLTVVLFLLLTFPTYAGSESELFTYDELAALYEKDSLPPTLETKLNKLLTTPFVDNSRTSNLPVILSQSPQLGEFLRVACWNVKRGIEYEAIEAAFTNAELFERLLDAEEFPPGSDERRRILEQAAILRAADVIILNEVDWGMKRTGYRNIAADLAARLGMNYAFGVQFVELSPVRLSSEPRHENAEENAVLDLIKVEPERYKGLHGIAILSRFPLTNVRLVPFKNQPYDWYKSEKNGTSILEKGKRQLSKKIFLEETLREVRRGGRTTLLADVADERFPAGRATIVATHLENRTKPSNRAKQLEELLETIKEIRNPIVVAGDMNTSTQDLTPTSVKRELMKRFGSPKFWLRRGINYALGFGAVENFLLSAISFGRNHADPTVKHVPFFVPNPERQFFNALQKFRFADGGAFDFRGDKSRSVGNKNKRLANSNERRSKGFVTTFRVNRPIKFIGKHKLDWIFVKPANLTNPVDRNQSYRFAPHFGRTLADLNRAIENGISDHRPLIVDLPLNEPRINNVDK